MSVPIFYYEGFFEQNALIALDETNSKHIVQVLRMQENQALALTNGKGYIAQAGIIEPNRKKIIVQVQTIQYYPLEQPFVGIGMAMLKNPNRIEWFLEKATEIGVQDIVLFTTKRTEKKTLNADRCKQKMIAALLQSQQAWLPNFKILSFQKALLECTYTHQYIAHCVEDTKLRFGDIQRREDIFIWIGPEGDFTTQEIEQAIEKKCQSLSLGKTRLRSETAGIVALSVAKNL